MSGRVWSLGLNVDSLTGEATAGSVIEHTTELGAAAGQVASFGIDAGRELYIVKYTGSIHRILSTAPPDPVNVTFVGVDATTRGNWLGTYGADGYAIVSDATSLPAYVTLAPSGHSTYVWAAATADPRGLQRAQEPGRVAATWYGAAFDLDLNLADGVPHQVAFYAVDWDSTIRQQRVDVFNAATGALLDSQTLSSYQGGGYLIWSLQGHVRVRFTRLDGANAVVSGVFFGTAGNLPPSVAMTSPSPGATFASPATVNLAADASDPNGTITSVAFYANSTLLSTDTTSPYTYSWSGMATGTYSLTAMATDDLGASVTSSPIAITVTGDAGAGSSAVFIATDSTRQGTWQGAYGADGYAIVGDVTSLPAYATMTPSGHASYTWAASTSDVRGLQRASGPERLAATWYADAWDLEYQFDRWADAPGCVLCRGLGHDGTTATRGRL